MIKSVTVINALGEAIRITLNDPEPEHGLVITNVDGLGPAKADIHTTDIATTDGSFFNSAVIEERNIVLSLLFVQNKSMSIEDVRQLTYKYFPLKKDVTLVIETDNRTLSITGYIESNDPDIFSENEGCQISMICPDPFFYDLTNGGTQYTVFSGIISKFHFPFHNAPVETKEIVFGQLVTLYENNVYYNGDADIGITITMHFIGPCRNIKIYDLKSNEEMFIDTDKLATLTGAALDYGDEIIISTVSGRKSVTLVRNARRTNILNCIDRQASWFKLSKGDNSFAYRVQEGPFNVRFTISNNVIFDGI